MAFCRPKTIIYKDFVLKIKKGIKSKDKKPQRQKATEHSKESKKRKNGPVRQVFIGACNLDLWIDFYIC